MFLEHLKSPFSISSKSNITVLIITKMIKNVRRKSHLFKTFLSAAGPVQFIEHFTAGREVAGSIPGDGPIIKVLT